MVFKVLVLGDMQTGKTSFIKTVEQSNIADFELYDSPVTDQFGLRAPQCHTYVICYNVIDEDSFNHVHSWMLNIRARHSSYVTILLAGTHSDLERPPRISFETAQNFAAEHSLLFAETSIYLPATVANACELLKQNLQPRNAANDEILSRLDRYIARVEEKEQHFYFFSNKRGQHRAEACAIAKQLAADLRNDPPITASFFGSHSIHSRELKKIINDAVHTFGGSRSPGVHPGL